MEINKTASEIMIRDVYLAQDTANVGDVLKLFAKYNISGVPIVNKKQEVVGYISDGDIMKFIAKQDPRVIDMVSFVTVWYDNQSLHKKLDDLMELPIMELATRKVISVEPDYNLDDVARILGNKKIKKVPVVENGKLIGIISRGDIIRYIVQEYFQ